MAYNRRPYKWCINEFSHSSRIMPLSLRISLIKRSRAPGYNFKTKHIQHHFDSSLIRRAEATGITYIQNNSVLLIDSPQGAWAWTCCTMGQFLCTCSFIGFDSLLSPLIEFKKKHIQLNFHVALRSEGLTRKALDIWKQ